MVNKKKKSIAAHRFSQQTYHLNPDHTPKVQDTTDNILVRFAAEDCESHSGNSALLALPVFAQQRPLAENAVAPKNSKQSQFLKS